MNAYEIMVIAFLVGAIGISIFARPTAKQASDMGLEPAPKRNSIGFIVGLCLPLMSTAYLLNLNEANLFGTALYGLWMIIGLGEILIEEINMFQIDPKDISDNSVNERANAPMEHAVVRRVGGRIDLISGAQRLHAEIQVHGKATVKVFGTEDTFEVRKVNGELVAT